MEKYLEANLESGKKFYQKFNDKGKITMLNLLKFKQKADYTNLEHIKPNKEISGEEAYQLYLKNTVIELKEAGSRIIYFGECSDFLIGPNTEKWNAILIVEHESVVKFMQFAENKDYLKYAGHRKAGLEDSRLLPSTEIQIS